jgi:hypothetical protein
MIIYHGSLEIVRQPHIVNPNRPLDFGKGFYTTTSLQQARRWVNLRMEQHNASLGYLNVYDYNPIKSLNVRRFRAANEPWVDFVHNNRTIPDYNHDYDIVIGPVANDNVYLSFNLYESGIISKKELIQRLRTYKLVDQLLFHTERSLVTLSFKNAKEIKL